MPRVYKTSALPLSYRLPAVFINFNGKFRFVVHLSLTLTYAMDLLPLDFILFKTGR